MGRISNILSPASKLRQMLLALCLLLSTAGMAQAQEITVGGTVTSATDGEPLIGATVAVKGSHEGVATDIDGVYSIKVSKGATLVFSYVGYTTREAKVSQSLTA